MLIAARKQQMNPTRPQDRHDGIMWHAAAVVIVAFVLMPGIRAEVPTGSRTRRIEADMEGVVGAAENVDVEHRPLPEEAGTRSEQPFDALATLAYSGHSTRFCAPIQGACHPQLGERRMEVGIAE